MPNQSHHREVLTRVELQVGLVQDRLGPTGVADGDVGEAERVPGRIGERTGIGGVRREHHGVGCVEDVEDPRRRRPSLGAQVEFGAGLAERQIDLRGEDQDGQRRAQREGAVEEAQAQEECHEGSADRGHGLEGQRRQEGDLQGGHPREVFRAAIRESSSAVVCAHNHPSGDPARTRPICR